MGHLPWGHCPQLVQSNSPVRRPLAILSFPKAVDRFGTAGTFESKDMFRLALRGYTMRGFQSPEERAGLTLDEFQLKTSELALLYPMQCGLINPGIRCVTCESKHFHAATEGQQKWDKSC